MAHEVFVTWDLLPGRFEYIYEEKPQFNCFKEDVQLHFQDKINCNQNKMHGQKLFLNYL